MTEKPIMLTTPKEVEVKEEIDKVADLALRQLINKKEAVIKAKLKEKKLLHILRDIDKKRFKPLMVEVQKDREVVWIDNGTYKGLRLVTFLNPTEPELNDKEFKTKLLYF